MTYEGRDTADNPRACRDMPWFRPNPKCANSVNRVFADLGTIAAYRGTARAIGRVVHFGTPQKIEELLWKSVGRRAPSCGDRRRWFGQAARARVEMCEKLEFSHNVEFSNNDLYLNLKP
jgi:hypothetical protein